ncbi:hypothetical protein C8R44DRAFT_749291 [Mycena epipterygia]|nr:hypothetical protein C8R44DRAFT_749291 [Mycena epipterygia]
MDFAWTPPFLLAASLLNPNLFVEPLSDIHVALWAHNLLAVALCARSKVACQSQQRGLTTMKDSRIFEVPTGAGATFRVSGFDATAARVKGIDQGAASGHLGRIGFDGFGDQDANLVGGYLVCQQELGAMRPILSQASAYPTPVLYVRSLMNTRDHNSTRESAAGAALVTTVKCHLVFLMDYPMGLGNEYATVIVFILKEDEKVGGGSGKNDAAAAL